MGQYDDLSTGKAGTDLESPQKREGRGILRTLSHEIRTPLNNIIGFADMMSAEMLGPMSHPQYREYAEDIRKSRSEERRVGKECRSRWWTYH